MSYCFVACDVSVVLSLSIWIQYYTDAYKIWMTLQNFLFWFRIYINIAYLMNRHLLSNILIPFRECFYQQTLWDKHSSCTSFFWSKSKPFWSYDRFSLIQQFTWLSTCRHVFLCIIFRDLQAVLAFSQHPAWDITPINP